MKTDQELQDLSYQDLKDYATDLELSFRGNIAKDKLIAMIEAKQNGTAFVDNDPPDIQSSLIIPDEIMLINGAILKRGQIAPAAQAMSGLSVDDWNALEADDRDDRLKRFINSLDTPTKTFPDPVVAEPTETMAARADELSALMADKYPGIIFTTDDISWQMDLGPKRISGSLTLPDNLVLTSAQTFFYNQ